MFFFLGDLDVNFVVTVFDPNTDDINNLKDNIPMSMVNLEKIFPPLFFDIMEHLAIHLARELELGCLVQ